MGNSCECIRRQSRDEAEDALLASLAGDSPTEGRPRGPPPPYQPQAPVYSYPLSAMTEERRLQLVRTVTIIQSLPCIPYEVRGDKDKKKDPRECAICMMDYSAGEPIKLLPCMHYYHLHCIDDWLMRSLTCPSCMQRVDAGLISTLSSSGGTTSTRGRSLGFSLRRRRRAAGTTTGDGEDPLVSGPASSSSSSRSSSTSSSREHLTIGGQQSSRSNVPFSPSHQLQSPRRITPSNSGTIFLPPFPSPRVPSRNIGPLPQIVSPPSSPGVFLINPSPPHSPQPLHVTIHTLPSPSPPPPPENPSPPPPPPPNQQQISQVN